MSNAGSNCARPTVFDPYMQLTDVHGDSQGGWHHHRWAGMAAPRQAKRIARLSEKADDATAKPHCGGMEVCGRASSM